MYDHINTFERYQELKRNMQCLVYRKDIDIQYIHPHLTTPYSFARNRSPPAFRLEVWIEEIG